jgi:signal transduction histidine kinase
VDALTIVNASLAGFFAFAATHYAVKWWLSRSERVLLIFAIHCLMFAVFSLAIISYFRARTIPDAQAALSRFVTVGLLNGVVGLEFHACLGNRRGRAFRAIVTAVFVFLALVNQWAPLRGIVALQTIQLPGGAAGFVPILTPSGATLALLYITVLAAQGYGLFVAHVLWRRDRAGAVFIALASGATLVGVAIAFLVHFGRVRAPYLGVLAGPIRVLFLALFLSREYSARAARVVASEKRAERSLRETQEALANVQAEQRRREEAERARQTAFEALIQAQRAEIASQLAAGIAHDFGNVLSVISTWSAVMLREARQPVHEERAREAIASALQQGHALSRQLLALAQPQTRSVTRVPLEPLIRATVLTLTPALPPGIQLRFEAHAAPEVEADEAELQQVIYNLVLNARDAMPDGGKLQITAGLETSTVPIGVVDGSLAAGRWATLTVTDSGPGIDPAIRERLFDLFFTTKADGRGTGLGLATVLRIAKISGGGVVLETEPGQGAMFKLYLPVA